MPYSDPDAQARYQNRWIKARRLEWVQKNGPCRKCGSGDGLEVDHIDPAKKVSHKIWSWRAERRDAELAKCQVICGACHKAKTREQFFKAFHGTFQRYATYGCRCSECTIANRDHSREIRRKKKKN